MVVVKRVLPSDLEAWRDVRLRALREAPYAFGSTYEREVAFTDEDWLQRINNLALFMAEVGDGIVGIIGGYRPSGQAETVREVVSMWVDPSVRGSGVSAELVQAIKDWSIQEGAEQLSLWVAEGNDRALAFYERMGFELTGGRKAGFDAENEDLHMSLPLKL